MKTLLKRIIPEPQRLRLRRGMARARNLGLARCCPVCRARLRQFAPHGDPVELEAVCPVCRSKAPHRLTALYFQAHPELFRGGQTLLHVAAEPELGRWLRRRAEANEMTYRTGSIGGKGATYLDLRELPFADESIDLIYCCHVLNAMAEDRTAMRELFRVLRGDGIALLQVPAFCTGPTTIEAPTRAARLHAFNDDGIYRCYTDADYVARLGAAGFEVSHVRAAQFGPATVARCALKSEVLHVCTRGAAKAKATCVAGLDVSANRAETAS